MNKDSTDRPNVSATVFRDDPDQEMREIREIQRRDGLRSAISALKERWAARRVSSPPPRTITPSFDPSLYDDVYVAGVRAMDADDDTFVGPPLVQVHGHGQAEARGQIATPATISGPAESTLGVADARPSSTVFLAPEAAYPIARPPYGETHTTFSLEEACATLARTEHAPPTQDVNDTLWIGLRLACEEISRLQDAIDRIAQEHVDQTDPRDPVGAALTAAGLCGPPVQR